MKLITDNPNQKHPIKAWTDFVDIEESAYRQLLNVATLPFIHGHIAIMPDVHWGMGATIGSVIPTKDAIIPAAVGVDIGCGMMAVQTTLKADQLPDNLKDIRSAIEAAIPHGRTHDGRAGDRGAWHNVPDVSAHEFLRLKKGLDEIEHKHPDIETSARRAPHHLGTLGTGNHFIELCLDENNFLWIMLHSGSRGIGNRIGMYFIGLAKKDMERHQIRLPDENLSYLNEGSELFDDYVKAVGWAQDFAKVNRSLMMEAVITAIHKHLPPFTLADVAINCHHNYVEREHHFGSDVWVTRKGAVRAQTGDLGIIPGSMGVKSFIVRGKGNPESFNSCSHGAGRTMSRAAAKRKFTLVDHAKATAGVECRKDRDVLDETPMAYKDIDAVMKSQSDLVEIVHTLKQVVCVKG